MADTPQRLSLAEAARSLAAQRRHGALAVVEADGIYPYCAASEYLCEENGDLLFFFSDLASHTRALQKHPEASLCVTSGLAEQDPLIYPRATYTGSTARVPSSDALKARWLAAFPGSRVYIDFSDFHFYRLHVERVRYIAGFGRMDWIPGARYREAELDPLWQVAPGAIAHMNQDHADSLAQMARHFAGIDWASDATMTQLDRYGLDILVRGPATSQTARIAFPASVTDPGAMRGAVVALAREAREALGERPPAEPPQQAPSGH